MIRKTGSLSSDKVEISEPILLLSQSRDQRAVSGSKTLGPEGRLFKKWEQFVLKQIVLKEYYKKVAFEKDIRLFNIALDYYPDSYMAYHDMANCYIEMKNKETG